MPSDRNSSLSQLHGNDLRILNNETVQISCGNEDVECTHIKCSGRPLRGVKDTANVEIKLRTTTEIIGKCIVTSEL